MKMSRLASGMFVASVLLAGCQNFFSSSSGSGSGGCTTSCSTVSSGVFYVLNSTTTTPEIAGFSIVSGSLTAVTGSPFNLPSVPYAIAVAPDNRFLYASTKTGIYLYTIGSTGGLTLASTTPVFTDFAAYSMQVDATNSWLVEVSGSGFLYAIPINPSTGVATGKVQQVSLAGITPRQMAITADNANVIVALGYSGTEVVPFSSTSADPLPSTASVPIAVKGGGGAAVSVAVDPANQLLYIGETLGTSGTTNTGILRAFLFSTLGGTPTEATGSPFASGGLTPFSILPTASGAYVYVANSTVSNSTTGNIAEFAVSQSGTAYTLKPLAATASAGVSPTGIAEDSTGSVVLLVNSGGTPDLDVYTFDTTTAGKLDYALSFATGTDPVGALGIAAAP